MSEENIKNNNQADGVGKSGLMRKLFFVEVPLYLVIIILLALSAGVIVFFRQYRNVIYDYNLYLPSVESQPSSSFNYGSWPELAKPDFFNEVKNKFIADKSNFVEIDLSQMKLRVYRDGAVAKEVPVLTKGKPGSWWQTPAGLYEIQGKIENQYSGFANVYMPWSMPFDGNFFMHGWPYYPDGTPVQSTYSGGCIRLNTEDAKAVYDMVEIGTPVLVFENESAADNFTYKRKEPVLSAPNYLAADLKNNFVFLKKNSDKQVPIASITKLITALVATEYINLEKSVSITNEMIVKTSIPRLWIGEEITAYNLLSLLLRESSNEAAFALADSVERERFMQLMNNKAKSLGMENTKFADPAGMEDGNVSTAEDLFRLAKHLYENRSFLLSMSADKIKVSAYDEEFSSLQNFNLFQDNPEFVGGKVGKSEAAGETMLAVFNLELGDAARPIVVIVLGSENNGNDVQTTVDYVKSSY